MTGLAAARAVLVVACFLGLVACGGRPALTAAPASSASLATATGMPTPYRTPAPATSPTLAGPRGAPVCRTSQLRVTVLRGLAAGGTAGGYLGFASHARRPCILHGWPTVVGVTSAGKTSTATHTLTTMFGPNVNAVPVVALKPGALAVAVFTVADGRPRYCPPPYRVLRVTPPGNDRPVVISAWLHPYVRGYLPACTRIWISPVVPAHDVYEP
jgi:Domain of unknown function (DUF4232)